MSRNQDHFYSNLRVSKMPLGQLLRNKNLFYSVPDDWSVIITDIKNSTVAVAGGFHEDVNLIATGSIVAVLNIAFKANILIPFFFGGDGATFIVPPSIVKPAMDALMKYKSNSQENFNLTLRAGIVPVSEIYKEKHSLKISRFTITDQFSIPIFLGDGLDYAERIIKGDDYLLADETTSVEDIDLTGMQCRWDKIQPPENSEEVVTLIVIAQDYTKQAEVFSNIIRHLDQIYGAPEKRRPISIPKLIFKTSFNNLGREMTNRLGKIKFFELVKTWMINLYGFVYFRTESGKKYLQQLVEMSDTLVIDGRINTVIIGTEKQRLALQGVLDALEQDNIIHYGLYVSGESVMSCYVRDLSDDHIHFVDGGDGGYTKAAAVLKQKLKAKT
ncbi:DUF3095 domain-containing protein [Pedobacter sandarakinus]|uniref:DUF3095 domain-containing protein n=1 Tax=Pedobacter sandarakinus TaxID=353156 RepID=UPI0022481FB0|nr:DUF3095 domain-containing protein [Pedobacter sandarakinus]MCX2574950.1 DUF3095 domain-containing protein [Pedobacter sandarakinus]